MEIMDSDETDRRFNIIVSNRGPKSTYAVWDNLVNGYYVDDLGNSKEFDSEWQAEAYLEEVLHSFPKQESYGDPEKPPVIKKAFHLLCNTDALTAHDLIQNHLLDFALVLNQPVHGEQPPSDTFHWVLTQK